MDGWSLALYAAAVYYSIRILLTFMQNHEQEFRSRLARERAAEAKKVAPTITAVAGMKTAADPKPAAAAAAVGKRGR